MTVDSLRGDVILLPPDAPFAASANDLPANLQTGDMMSIDNPWVVVGKVPFGKGVFARRLIPAGTDIGQVEGRVIDDPNYASAYCIDLGDSLSLEPRPPFRYLNHRCQPNCTLHQFEVVYEDGTPAPAEVHLEAIVDIPEGAELTIDYQWSADGAIKCLCGSEQCRGWVVAAEELPKLLESRQRSRSKARPR